ncbi:hypothetical protein L9F63_008277, partial [Diploptera punctata]
GECKRRLKKQNCHPSKTLIGHHFPERIPATGKKARPKMVKEKNRYIGAVNVRLD